VTVDLRVRSGGAGEPVLLLLHGLGATNEVWRGWAPVLAGAWPGRWVAPDLPGHGGSAHLAAYTFEAMASAVAGAVEPGAPTVVLGHSLGGVLGLVLAGGGHGLDVRAAVGLGIKVEWSPDDLVRAGAIAARPVAWQDSRDEAAARHLRFAGLTGLLAADDPAVDAGLRQEDGRWRLAMDQRAFGVGAPDMPRLLAAATAPVVLARGEHDPMCTDDQVARLGARSVVLPGLGHNAHVESPAAAFGPLLAWTLRE
jgi:pimeloyl-ACP methyl ester carboxylesterase